LSTEKGVEKLIQKEKPLEMELPAPALSKWEKEELPSDSVFDSSVDEGSQTTTSERMTLLKQHSLEIIAKNEPESSYIRELVAVHGVMHGVEPMVKDEAQDGDASREFHAESSKPQAGPQNVLRKALGEIAETDSKRNSEKNDPENCENLDETPKKSKKKKIKI
jgi:hypothetical protein